MSYFRRLDMLFPLDDRHPHPDEVVLGADHAWREGNTAL